MKNVNNFNSISTNSLAKLRSHLPRGYSDLIVNRLKNKSINCSKSTVYAYILGRVKATNTAIIDEAIMLAKEYQESIINSKNSFEDQINSLLNSNSDEHSNTAGSDNFAGNLGTAIEGVTGN